MRTALLSCLLFAALSGCAQTVVTDQECEDFCSLMVRDCEFDAYPSMESCTNACSYYKQEGYDMADEIACIEDAISEDGVCDTFAVIECENRYGASAE